MDSQIDHRFRILHQILRFSGRKPIKAAIYMRLSTNEFQLSSHRFQEKFRELLAASTLQS
jgi:hypothetical protein